MNDQMLSRPWWFLGTAFGIGITPAAIFFAIESAGAGHGNYGLARVLFPYPTLITLFANNSITLPIVCAAIIQFPVYGLFLDLCFKRRQLLAGFIELMVIHVIAAITCFSGLLPYFSK